MEGFFVDLKKPFAVMMKEGGRNGGGGEGEGRRESLCGGNGNGDDDGTRYRVVGIVRRKCLFKARPRALIARLT